MESKANVRQGAWLPTHLQTSTMPKASASTNRLSSRAVEPKQGRSENSLRRHLRGESVVKRIAGLFPDLCGKRTGIVPKTGDRSSVGWVSGAQPTRGQGLATGGLRSA